MIGWSRRFSRVFRTDGVTRGEAVFPPPPCGEGSGVVPEGATPARSLYAEPLRSFLGHPHPYPPHKGGRAVGVARLTARKCVA
jgi:hypothetical protein